VRYLLEGSVQRSSGQVRVTAQLIDADTDAHLWAERFDRDPSEMFASHDEITRRIAIALNLELVAAEAARPVEHPDAFDYILRGRAAFLKPLSRRTYAEAAGMYERALARDPGSVTAQSALAASLAGRAMEGMTDNRAAGIERAARLAAEALITSPRSPLAHFAMGQVLRAQDRYREAIPGYETAVAYNRNWVVAISALADCKLHAGPVEEVVPLQEQALRLSPRDPYIANMYGRIGVAYQLQSRIDQAIDWSERARAANPVRGNPHGVLASAYALKGDTQRAAAELAEARRLDNDFLFSTTAAVKARYFEVPKIRTLFETTLLAGLRKAGVPEE
jgi:tetratricopeptide (TPR) repeat protein